jgi:hypothetical protein
MIRLGLHAAYREAASHLGFSALDVCLASPLSDQKPHICGIPTTSLHHPLNIHADLLLM